VQADGATDEVYARVSLLPEDEEAERRGRARALEDEDAARDGEGGGAMKPLARTPHMFCKTLTASDTSTHGGFSVPRRAAEDCFPPLVRLDWHGRKKFHLFCARLMLRAAVLNQVVLGRAGLQPAAAVAGTCRQGFARD